MIVVPFSAEPLLIRQFPGKATGTNGVQGVGHRVSSDPAWTTTFRELDNLSNLSVDWDGQGAAAPDAAIVRSAKNLAQYYHNNGVPAPQRIVPGVCGTILLEWQDGDVYCEIEITGDQRAEGILMTLGQPPQTWTIANA